MDIALCVMRVGMQVGLCIVCPCVYDASKVMQCIVVLAREVP